MLRGGDGGNWGVDDLQAYCGEGLRGGERVCLSFEWSLPLTAVPEEEEEYEDSDEDEDEDEEPGDWHDSGMGVFNLSSSSPSSASSSISISFTTMTFLRFVDLEGGVGGGAGD